MGVVLVLGVSGSGKSTLAVELGRRGLDAVDSDQVLGRWVDGSGDPVRRPEAPDRTWLADHQWQWDRGDAERLLASATGTVFVCGQADNVTEFFGLFDLVILLELDTPTMLKRLDDPARDNDFGRTGDTRELLIDWAPGFQARMKELGAVVVDGRLPLAVVVDTVIRLAGHGGQTAASTC
ncbi:MULTISPECIES: AAA family ATPase [unclassified Streptomyces]|uniref:AAA family ATPase n=1 Tax=unclassified Streptomyces TaxID=2593676 RepID=UPI00364CAF27